MAGIGSKGMNLNISCGHEPFYVYFLKEEEEEAAAANIYSLTVETLLGDSQGTYTAVWRHREHVESCVSTKEKQ